MLPIIVTVVLVQLTGPDNQIIWVNPEEIVSIRAPRESQQHHFDNDIKCTLQTVDGKLINVIDSCDEVRNKVGIRP
jgi:uncharacterized protein YlzI (FlbEa/FlbD family)